jgi:hypothetical protein
MSSAGKKQKLVDKYSNISYNIGIVSKTERKMSVVAQIVVLSVVLVTALAVSVVALNLSQGEDE